MIPSFEDQTHELTEYEYNVLLPLMIAGFKTKIGAEKCITNPEICRALKEKGYEVTEPRIRKLVFHIRFYNLVPKLIASSKGYWVATNKQEVDTWIQSLQSRISALEETLNYAKGMLKDFGNDYDNF
jgi:arginine repressor